MFIAWQPYIATHRLCSVCFHSLTNTPLPLSKTLRHVAWLCQYSVRCLVFTHLWHVSRPPPGDMNLDWNDYHLNGNCSGWGNLAQQEIPGFLTLNLLTMLSTRISVTHDRKLSQSKGSWHCIDWLATRPDHSYKYSWWMVVLWLAWCWEMLM